MHKFISFIVIEVSSTVSCKSPAAIEEASSLIDVNIFAIATGIDSHNNFDNLSFF